MQFKDALAGFQNYLRLERDAAVHTQENYRRDIEQFCKLVLDGDIRYKLSPSAMTLFKAREYLMKLNELQLARNSILRKISSMRGFCKYLVREEVLEDNPFKSLNSSCGPLFGI